MVEHVQKAGSVPVRQRDPLGGKMEGSAGRWRRGAVALLKHPCWQVEMKGTEFAGTRLTGCTSYPRGGTGTL